MKITSSRLLSIAIVLFLIASGCNRPKSTDASPGDTPGSVLSGLPGHDGPAAAPRFASARYFEDARSIPSQLAAKIGGPARALEVIVYPERASAQLQDPTKRENADAYELRDGAVGESVPVEFVGNAPTAKDLDEVTFDLATIDFTAVPRMVSDALVQLTIEGGKVTHLLLKRGLPFHNEVRWRVFVKGTRRSGSVEYDTKGHLVKVWS